MTDETDETDETEEILERPDDDALVAAWNALKTDPGALGPVYAETHALARRLRFEAAPARLEDAASTVAISCQARASRESFVFEHAGKVRAYLKTALRHELARLAKSRERPDETVDERADTTPHRRSFDQDVLQPALDALVTDVVEPCGRQQRAGRLEAMLKSFSEMVAVCFELATVAELVGVPTDAPDFGRLRGAMYQRHSRDRRSLLEYLDDSAAHLDADAIAHYRGILDALRRRSDGGRR